METEKWDFSNGYGVTKPTLESPSMEFVKGLGLVVLIIGCTHFISSLFFGEHLPSRATYGEIATAFLWGLIKWQNSRHAWNKYYNEWNRRRILAEQR